VFGVSGTSVEYAKVGDLKPGFRDLKMVLKVLDIGVQRAVSFRRDRYQHTITEVLVGDETGSVLLTLWDNQVNNLSVGDVFEIKRGYSSLFKGYLRLNIGRHEIPVKLDKEINVNTKNNLSESRHESTLWYRPTGRPFRRRRRR
jgi:replication factor A1